MEQKLEAFTPQIATVEGNIWAMDKSIKIEQPMLCC